MISLSDPDRASGNYRSYRRVRGVIARDGDIAVSGGRFAADPDRGAANLHRALICRWLLKADPWRRWQVRGRVVRG
jgi:hypothetical protein